MNNKIELSKLAQNNGSNHSLKLAIKDILQFEDTLQRVTFVNQTEIINIKNGFVYYHTYKTKRQKEEIEGRINIDTFGNIEYSINSEICTKYIFRIFLRMAKLKCKFRFEYVYPHSKTSMFIFLTL